MYHPALQMRKLRPTHLTVSPKVTERERDGTVRNGAAAARDVRADTRRTLSGLEHGGRSKMSGKGH